VNVSNGRRLSIGVGNLILVTTQQLPQPSATLKQMKIRRQTTRNNGFRLQFSTTPGLIQRRVLTRNHPSILTR